MFVPIMHQKPVAVEKQNPCKDGCMYAKDVGMQEHSCSGLYCDHYEEEQCSNQQKPSDTK